MHLAGQLHRPRPASARVALCAGRAPSPPDPPRDRGQGLMQQDRILHYLPENYQLAAADERGVMRGMLAVMEGMHAPVDQVIRSLDSFFDPNRAPDAFVLLQASWLGLDRYFDWSGGSPGLG